MHAEHTIGEALEQRTTVLFSAMFLHMKSNNMDAMKYTTIIPVSMEGKAERYEIVVEVNNMKAIG